MDAQRTYCNFDCFEYISQFSDEDSACQILNDIIYDHSDVILDIEEDEFEELVKENAFFKALFKRPSFEVVGLPGFFENLEEEDFGLANYAKDIFILAKDEEFCDRQRRTKGALVISQEKLDFVHTLMPVFKKVLPWNTEPSIEKNNVIFKGWKCLLAQKKVFPANAVVLIDNYIFKDHNDFKEENLFAIVESLLSDELEVTLHFTIVTDNRDAKISSDRALRILHEIETRYNVNDQTKVRASIVTHSNNLNIHKRILLTNYHYFWSDHGFSIFRRNKVYRSTDIDIAWIYQSIQHRSSDIEAKFRNHFLKIVKDQIARCNGNADRLEFVTGQCDNPLLS